MSGDLISGILVGLATIMQPAGQFEQDLGFALPAPYVWRNDSSASAPLYMPCTEPPDCRHFDRGHWVYTGHIDAPRESENLGDVPPLSTLLHENGWIAMRPQDDGQVSWYRKTDALEPGICAKYITVDRDYPTTLGLTFYILPCIDGTTQ